MYRLRSIYYKLIKKYSSVEQIEHFTGFGLYDKSFVDVMRKLDDPTPFLRGVVAELGFKREASLLVEFLLIAALCERAVLIHAACLLTCLSARSSVHIAGARFSGSCRSGCFGSGSAVGVPRGGSPCRYRFAP